jgi:hypothetical protein
MPTRALGPRWSGAWEIAAARTGGSTTYRRPEERAAEIAARTLALPDAQSVEDLTALLISAGER